MKITEKHIRLVGPFILSLLLSHFVETDKAYWRVFVAGLFFSTSVWWGNSAIWYEIKKRFSDFRQIKKRIWYLAIFTILYTLLASFTMSVVVANFVMFCELTWDRYLQDLQKSSYITLVFVLLYESNYFFTQWKKSLLEAEKLKTQQLRSQFESLRNQISPHFLFNSLNTLASLIPENANLAVNFTEELARVYRYILQNKDKELISLQTELDFAKSYTFLQKNRFGDNLQISFEIEDKHLQMKVAPFTLQMLIENAIKHNIISKQKPLTIEVIMAKENFLMVKNNLQKKNSVRNSTKIGLENIRKRYEYLSNQSIEIIQTTQNFSVLFPLIKT